jgi:hypothetical protein
MSTRPREEKFKQTKGFANKCLGLGFRVKYGHVYKKLMQTFSRKNKIHFSLKD